MQELPEMVGRMGVSMPSGCGANSRIETDENAQKIWCEDVGKLWKMGIC
jgi:hypothetical protein